MSWLDEIINEVTEPQKDNVPGTTPPEADDKSQGQENAPVARTTGKMTYCDAFYKAFPQASKAPAPDGGH